MASVSCRSRKEPVVIQVPDFGGRFWVYQICRPAYGRFWLRSARCMASKPGFLSARRAELKGKRRRRASRRFSAHPPILGVVIPPVFVNDNGADKQAAADR